MHDEAAPKSFWSHFQLRLAQARFLTFSILVHALLVIFGGGVVLYRQIADPPDFVAESGSLMSEDTAVRPPEDQPLTFSDMTPKPSAPELAAPTFDTLTTLAASTPFSVPSAKIPNPTGQGMEQVTSKLASLGKGLPTAGLGRKGGTMMRFFGVMAKAESVVFVVDVSGSMVMGKKSVATYEVLEKEVLKVIRDLNPADLFGIVAFSKEAEAYKASLVRATNEEKQRAVAWLKKWNPEAYVDPKVKPEKKDLHRGTRADLGLARAFEMKPQAVFFVSDGEPSGAKPAAILQTVQQQQSDPANRTIIHTIAYLADSGQKFMRQLAEQNGGTFREVNPRNAK